jgi:hypothetical protein
MPVFKRLSQHFKYAPLKFGELIKEQYAIVGKRYFTGHRGRTSAHQRHRRDGVVRGTEWAGRHQH